MKAGVALTSGYMSLIRELMLWMRLCLPCWNAIEFHERKKEKERLIRDSFSTKYN